MNEKIMKDIKDTVCCAGKCAYNTTTELVETAKITLAIEKRKCRLSKIYEEIGEAVVSGKLSCPNGKENIYRLIDEAKHEKAIINALYDKRKHPFSDFGECGN
jgi:hypothetical protein